MKSNDLFQLFVSFPALLFNIFAFVVLLRSSKLPHQIRIFALNLCLAECFICLILCIDRRVFGWIFGTTDVKYFLIPLFSHIALIIITYFNCDRFLAFKMALRYYTFISPKRVKSACALAWCFGSLVTTLQFCSLVEAEFCEGLDYEISSRLSEFTFATIYTSNFVLFGYIVYKIKVAMHQVKPTGGIHSTDNTKQAGNFNYQTTGQKTFKKVALITGTFLGLYAPGMAWVLAKPYVSNPMVYVYMNRISGLLFLFSAILDPIFYALRFSECRFQLLLLRYTCNTEKYNEVLKKRNQHYATFCIDIPSEPGIDVSKV
jgi:hypothetical protein